MTGAELAAFAAEWVAAWNAHDLERILSHYSDDMVFDSPGVQIVMGDPSGRVVGKGALKTYWQTAMARSPGLQFELRGAFAGPRGCALRYWNANLQAEVIEVFEFNDRRLVCAGGAYRAVETV